MPEDFGNGWCLDLVVCNKGKIQIQVQNHVTNENQMCFGVMSNML